MTQAGVDVISDSVARIQMVISEDKFSIEQLEAIAKIYETALRSTRETIQRAEKSIQGEP